MELLQKLKDELICTKTTKIISTVSKSGNPSISFRRALFFNDKGELVLLEPTETSEISRNLVYSLWFDKKVIIAILCKNKDGLLIQASPIRAIVAGKDFEKYYYEYLEKYSKLDLAVAWIMKIDKIVEAGEEIDILNEKRNYPFIGHLDGM